MCATPMNRSFFDEYLAGQPKQLSSEALGGMAIGGGYSRGDIDLSNTLIFEDLATGYGQRTERDVRRHSLTEKGLDLLDMLESRRKAGQSLNEDGSHAIQILKYIKRQKPISEWFLEDNPAPWARPTFEELYDNGYIY